MGSQLGSKGPMKSHVYLVKFSGAQCYYQIPQGVCDRQTTEKPIL